MRSTVALGGALCLSVFLTACTTTQTYNLIDADARPHIQQMDSVLISKQGEVRADIKTSKLSKYVQGHFAPVLFDLAVNGVRMHKANKIMQPIRETLYGYDFTLDIQEEFTEALSASELGDMGELRVLRQEKQGFRAAYVQESNADAVMFIDVDVAFTPSFNALNLTSHVMVFPVSDALSAYKEKPDNDDILEYEDNIYRNQFVAAIPSGAGEDSKKSEHGAAWAEMSEERLTGLMQTAAQKLASHIANDLSTNEAVESDSDALEATEKEETPAPTEVVLNEAQDPV